MVMDKVLLTDMNHQESTTLVRERVSNFVYIVTHSLPKDSHLVFFLGFKPETYYMRLKSLNHNAIEVYYKKLYTIQNHSVNQSVSFTTMQFFSVYTNFISAYRIALES